MVWKGSRIKLRYYPRNFSGETDDKYEEFVNIDHANAYIRTGVLLNSSQNSLK
jgi:hypothetical protein